MHSLPQKPIFKNGFTLIELIISIVVTVIIAGVAYPIIIYSTRSYNQQVYRKEVSSRARLALERIARELRTAVPNSIRITTNLNTNDTLEFGNSVFLSTYSAISGTVSPYILQDDSGTPSIPDASFIVIYNTSPSQYYSYSSAASTSTFQVTSVNAAAGTIQFASPTTKPESPYSRYVLSDTPVCYSLEADNTLYRYSGYNPSITQNHTGAANKNLLIDHITGLEFNYIPGALSNAGLVMINMTVSVGNATMNFHQEVHIRNAP